MTFFKLPDTEPRQHLIGTDNKGPIYSWTAVCNGVRLACVVCGPMSLHAVPIPEDENGVYGARLVTHDGRVMAQTTLVNLHRDDDDGEL